MTEAGQQIKLETQEQKALMEKIMQARRKKDLLFKKNDRNFRVAGVFTLLGIVFCAYKVPAFREQATQSGIYVAQPYFLWWCLAGFLFQMIFRKLFSELTSGFFEKRLHPKTQYYNAEERDDKLKIIVRQTYEGIFYTLSSLYVLLFREQQWFPTVLGGTGSCQNIFKNYPHWPQQNSDLLQILLQFQLGTYVFYFLDLLYLSRERYLKKNFGEILFHHVTTIMLIGFTLLYNLVNNGALLLIAFDLSDAFRGFSRTIGQSKLCIKYPLFFDFWTGLYLGSWIYLRILVVPFCMIQSMYDALPVEGSPWTTISVPLTCFLVLLFFIFSIQWYWVFLMCRGVNDERTKNKFFIEQDKKNEEKKSS